MPDTSAGSTIIIRDIESVSELRAVETLQKDVWGIDDLDVVPFTLLVASKEVGAVLVGAFDGPSLVGFVYGFPGYEAGHLTHHSHMLAVRPEYRNHKLGFKLKLVQRERVLAQGIDRITWTFDPLQSLNAHLNFGKLGVIADTYKINFYGAATSSFLHQIGTDRLWVTWLIESERVRARLNVDADRNLRPSGSENAPALVQVGSSGAPIKTDSPEIFRHANLSIEIPSDINALQRDRPQVAVEWREATRRAFTSALASGYLVEDFYQKSKGDQPRGAYLLTRNKG